jgi:hypothetical protein
LRWTRGAAIPSALRSKRMSKKKAADANETLTGIITPIQWNENDQVTAVALSATDDEEYWIDNGEKFIDLVQKCIEAHGKIKRDRKSTKSITIKRFNIIESF